MISSRNLHFQQLSPAHKRITSSAGRGLDPNEKASAPLKYQDHVEEASMQVVPKKVDKFTNVSKNEGLSLEGFIKKTFERLSSYSSC
jgi:hypothetical protein